MSASTGSGGRCGAPHDKDCSEVLERVFFFIDNELPTADFAEIQHHLDECGPCLREFGLEDAVKKLVRQRCCDPAPADLRAKVLVRIQEVRATIEVVD